MQTQDQRDERENPDREQESPHEPTEPSRSEQYGMMLKPSDLTSKTRERFRGIMI